MSKRYKKPRTKFSVGETPFTTWEERLKCLEAGLIEARQQYLATRNVYWRVVFVQTRINIRKLRLGLYFYEPPTTPYFKIF